MEFITLVIINYALIPSDFAYDVATIARNLGWLDAPDVLELVDMSASIDA